MFKISVPGIIIFTNMYADVWISVDLNLYMFFKIYSVVAWEFIKNNIAGWEENRPMTLISVCMKRPKLHIKLNKFWLTILYQQSRSSHSIYSYNSVIVRCELTI